jgi:hypothetical protein
VALRAFATDVMVGDEARVPSLNIGLRIHKHPIQLPDVTDERWVSHFDFGFWIFPTDESGGLKFRKKFIFFHARLPSTSSTELISNFLNSK